MDLAGRYLLSRDGAQFGPYTLDQLHDFRRRGNAVDTDWVWGEGMSEWQPLGRLLDGPKAEADGSAAVEPSPVAPQAERSAGGMFGVPAAAAPRAGGVVAPPSLHWALVLLFAVLTCGLFSLVWMFVQAVWVKKVDRESNAIPVLAVGLVVTIGLVLAGTSLQNGAGETIVFIARLCQVAAFLVAYFSMKASLETYFNRDEPIGLQLSGILTFFFGVFYFQYHFTRIAQWKATGHIDPQ